MSDSTAVRRCPQTDGPTNGASVTAPMLADLLAAARQVAKPKRRMFAGKPEQARHARQFVARVLGSCPITDTAVLLSSELVTNALTHTRSQASGSFQVIVWPGRTTAYVAVIDEGSHTEPVMHRSQTADLSESGASNSSTCWPRAGATTDTAAIPHSQSFGSNSIDHPATPRQPRDRPVPRHGAGAEPDFTHLRRAGTLSEGRRRG